MIPLACLSVLVGASLAEPGAKAAGAVQFHLEDSARDRIAAVLSAAAGGLFKLQSPDGSFAGDPRAGIPPVPLTALVVWALCESGQATHSPENTQRAVRYLLSHTQPDGGIYDPRRGLVRYTAAVVRQALDAYSRQLSDPPLGRVMERLNLFVYQNRDPESLEDEQARLSPGPAAAAVDKLAGVKHQLSLEARSAVEFLERAREKPMARHPTSRRSVEPAGGAGNAITYEELLRYLCELPRQDNPTVSRAYVAIQSYYSVSENPDLTRRFGPAGFQRKDAGLFYYYLTLARTLGAVGRPDLRTTSGKVHDWARELSDRLLMLRNADGLWANRNSRWYEGEPVLATAFAMLSLSVCRDVRAASR